MICVKYFKFLKYFLKIIFLKNKNIKYKRIFSAINSRKNIIKKSGLYNYKYCISHGGPFLWPIEYYLLGKGWKNFELSSKFDSKFYKKLYNVKGNPLIHYIIEGHKYGFYRFNRKTEFKYSKKYKIKSDNKLSVYTCIIGSYDELIPQSYVDTNYDYYCFTDNLELLRKEKYYNWKIMEIPSRILALEKSDLINRYVKLFPWDVLDGRYTKSIYIDGNINILTSKLYDIIDIKNIKYDILVPEHFMRDCCYAEQDWYCGAMPQHISSILSLREIMRQDCFPEHYGLSENNIIYRHHINQKIRDIMNEWWEMLLKYVCRDQIQFPYVLWKYGIDIKNILLPACRSDYLNYAFYPHNTSTIQISNIGKSNV